MGTAAGCWDGALFICSDCVGADLRFDRHHSQLVHWQVSSDYEHPSRHHCVYVLHLVAVFNLDVCVRHLLLHAAKLLAELPVSCIFPLVFGGVVYPFTGLNPKPSR